MTNDLYTIFPELITTERKARALAAMIPAPSGIIILTAEEVSSYLHEKRNEAMAKAMRTLNENTSQFRNMVSQFENDFFMYSQYNLEITEKIIEYLNGMMKRLENSSLESTMKAWEINLPSFYLHYALKQALYGFQLQPYLLTLCERHANMYVITARTKNSKGYFSPEVFTPSKLKFITDIVISMYVFALPHMTSSML